MAKINNELLYFPLHAKKCQHAALKKEIIFYRKWNYGIVAVEETFATIILTWVKPIKTETICSERTKLFYYSSKTLQIV